MAIGPNSVEEPLIIDGREVGSVPNFIGFLITKDGDCSQELQWFGNGMINNDEPV